MSVEVTPFGLLPDGRAAQLFSLTNLHGLVARISDYGATLTELHAPDRNGTIGDVVLGFDDLTSYLAGHPYFGSTVGRVANRIAGGTFDLDGHTYTLARNDGPHHLHGGRHGFDKALWRGEAMPGPDPAVRLVRVSPDGDEGYPGRLEVEVVMALTAEDALVIDFTARTDHPTPVNLANHAYFNLACSGDVLNHELWLRASRYTPVDATGIPTGKLLPVQGTPFDFTRPALIGARWDALTGSRGGYDHNFVIDRDGPGLVQAGRLFDPESGRVMDVRTTQPGVQLYTGNFLDGTLTGKGGRTYGRHTGLCLETQHYPDAVHHPGFPGTILRPEETLRETTVYAFRVS